MRGMRRQHITRLEAQLEALVEATFANLFGRQLRAADIAVKLARSMEGGLRGTVGTVSVAPDRYTIALNDSVHQALTQRHPQLSAQLAEHLVELATQCGYRLREAPTVKLIADSSLPTGRVIVSAGHTDVLDASRTDVMQQINIQHSARPVNAQLMIGGVVYPLERDVINIGRQRDNHIVLNDPTVSRHHIQMRLRFGDYYVFNTQGRTGTYVNGVRVKEHRLKSGDVITVGRTQMLYTYDVPDDDTGVTGELDAI
jgi:hypothetical protein